MTLTCECYDDYEWYYNKPEDYSILQTKRRRRCQSCRQLIDIGAICLEFERFRIDEDGEDIYLADKYLCESCGDIFYSFDELGFCITLGDDLHDLLNEYHEVYGTNHGKHSTL